MSTEELKIVVEKYGLVFDQDATAMLNAISKLPTSSIEELFNEIAITDVFRPKTESRLF